MDNDEIEKMRIRRSQLWISMNATYGINPSTSLTDEARDRYIEMYKEYMELGKKIRDHTRLG